MHVGGQVAAGAASVGVPQLDSHSLRAPGWCPMFGRLAFMTGGHLAVGVYGDGLIARIGAQDMDAAIAEPGVRPLRRDRSQPGR